MFYRIGEVVISDDKERDILSRLTREQDLLLLEFWDDRSLTLSPSQDEFVQYSAFFNSCPTLFEKLQVNRLKSIQEQNVHSLKTELPRTLFPIFQGLSDDFDLELRIEQDGAGSLWTKEKCPQQLLGWSNFDEGIYKLLRYKNKAA